MSERLMQWYGRFSREIREQGLVIALIVAVLEVVREMLQHYFLGRLNEFVAKHSASWLGMLSSAVAYLMRSPLVLALFVFVILVCLLTVHAYLETRKKPASAVGESESTAPAPSDSNGIQVKATRVEWWNGKIQSVIRDSNKLVVIDSFLGHDHVFWDALTKRFIDDPKPFHFVYLMLRDGDPFLERCLKLVGVPASLTQVDKDMIAEINQERRSFNSSNKKLEFYFWEGISPGPLVAWTIDGKETIGLGLWVQLREATDLTPYLIVRGGSLFTTLKRHYESMIVKARSNRAEVLPTRMP